MAQRMYRQIQSVDPYENIDYFETIGKLWKLAIMGDQNINLMGIDSMYPSDKYGYIMPISKAKINKVGHIRNSLM